MSSCRRSWAQIVPYTPPVHPLTPAHVAWVRSQRDNGAMALYALGDKTPDIDPTAFVHPDAVIIGDVRVGPESSVWPTAVLRGDHGAIVVGSQTSIQDGTIVHCTGKQDTIIGDRCVVGHNSHLEGCRVEDDSLIGSGSVLLHGVRVGPQALVGAGAVVSPGIIIGIVAAGPGAVRGGGGDGGGDGRVFSSKIPAPNIFIIIRVKIIIRPRV